jgi:hypothetical protein
LEHGLRFTMLPHPGPGGLADGIASVKRLLGRCVFDASRCEQGLDALRNYVRVKDERLQAFANHPLHNWASNGADAFRYAAVGLQPALAPLRPQPPGGSIAWAREEIRRAKRGLPPRTYRVGS